MATVCMLLNGASAFSGDLKCYEYTSTTSHFECGTYGNCTWWAAFMRPDLASAGITGDAGYWYNNAGNLGFDLGSEPKIGAIAVFSDFGHVAYVEGVGSDGSFSVSEMDYYGTLGSGYGVQYATYYPNSDGTYKRATGAHNWVLAGFIYRRDYGTNLYCDDINSVWGICWTPSSTDVSCKGGKDWTLHDFEQGSVIRVSTNEYCPKVGGVGGGIPNDPEPTDPDYDPNIHINSLDIRLLGGSYVKEIQKTLYWGQSFQFEGRAQFENRSSQVAEDIDADYRITDSRSLFNEDATKIDEDGAFDIDPGEREENSISPITVTVSADGTKVSYSQGSMTRSFDVINGFSKVYIFADIEVNGDKDISSPSDHDEYGKIELIIQRPPCQPSFTQNPSSGVRPLVVSFTNTSVSNAADCVYTWSFGDGGTSNVYNPSYLYNNAGTFTPKLTGSSYSYNYSGTKTGSNISVANPIPPSIVITNPTSTDKWRSDSSSHYIQWNYYNFPSRGTVNIHYTYDGGATWRRIEPSVTNDGSRRWYMCNSTTKDSANSYVRVCSNEYGVCGVSQKFYIDHASGCK